MSRATYYNLKKNTKKTRDPQTVSSRNGLWETGLTNSSAIPDKINKSTSKTKFSVGKHVGSTDPDAVLKAEFENKVAKRIQTTENHEFLKWTDLKKICIEIRDMETRIEFQCFLTEDSIRPI